MRIELQQVSYCTGCGGRCCRHIGMPPFEAPNPDLAGAPVELPKDSVQARDRAIFEAMPAELRADHAARLLALTEDPTGTPCAWLNPETGECGHYEYRPTNCREFVPGCDECRVMRRTGHPCVWDTELTLAMWLNPFLRQARRLRPAV